MNDGSPTLPIAPVQLPEGTIIVEHIIGSIITAVHYPWRKSPDAYMVPNDLPLIRCLQCNRDIYKGEYTLVGHIRRHDRRKTVRKLADL